MSLYMTFVRHAYSTDDIRYEERVRYGDDKPFLVLMTVESGIGTWNSVINSI